MQVKCYMKQLISGLEHCHSNGVLHRDIKCSNLLIDNEGILKIADFGLASVYDPKFKKPMTSRVVTLWYRPPELLLGATYYGVGVDLWSAGCILAELLSGKPILRGRTEVYFRLYIDIDNFFYFLFFYFFKLNIILVLRWSSCTRYSSYVVLQVKNIGRNPNCLMQLFINPSNLINLA